MLRKLSIALMVSGASASVTVKSPLGNVVGNLDTTHGVSSFKGIPYAKAPIGDLRFADPQAWKDTYATSGLDATAFKSQCVCESQGGSEDCLFMNIYVPSAQPSSADKKPILFFIHGGAFVIGAGSDYDGTVLAKKHDAVVVTINYRLGSFGWAQLVRGAANFGLKDQREAMRFVQRATGGVEFISAFGGDTSRLMVLGESAGAISVANHLVTPKSFGLFTSALMESGMPTAKTQPIALSQGANLTQAAGCSGASDVLLCMRGKKTKEITSAEKVIDPPAANVFTTTGWGPTVDLIDIMEDPLQSFIKGKNQKVPVAAGSNTDEGDLFVYPSFPLGMSNAQYETFVQEFLSNGRPFNQSTYEQVLEMYPPSTSNRKTASSILADATFVCGAKAVVQHTEQSFLYHFNYGAPLPVIHSSELSYVFESGKMNAQKETLSENIGRFWESLAATGKPGTEQEWPEYKNATDKNIVLDGKLSIETGRRAKYCDFWLQTLASGFNAQDAIRYLAKLHPSSKTETAVVIV